MKTPKIEHTPTPWAVCNDYLCIFQEEKEEEICTFNYINSDKQDKANAEFIVKAVNAYDQNQATIKALVEVCKNAFNSLRTFRNVPKNEQEWTSLDDYVMKQLESALKQAGE